MKSELDREMDSLLRGAKSALGGRGGVRPTGAHLDADELSAYAENALPPATRARYTAHLADCPNCRRLVTGVAVAAGVEVGRGARVAASPVKSSAPWWRAGFASLLAPRFLRYAAPVLAVAIFAALALVVLRRDRQADQVAYAPQETNQRVSITQPSSGEATTGTTGGAPSAATGGTAAPAGQTTGTAANTSTAAAQPKETQSVEKDANNSFVVDGADKDKAEDYVGGIATKSAPAPPPASNQPGTSSGVAAAAPAPVVAEASEPESRREGREVLKESKPAPKAADEEYRIGTRQQPEVARGGSADDNRAAGGGPAASAARQRAAKPGILGGLSAKREKKDEDAQRDAAANETNRVAGHEFRRDGGAWVDVNYRPSMSASEVRRGSERFRTLAADYPEVERAASQLRGTFIIVVVGRAYKIR